MNSSTPLKRIRFRGENQFTFDSSAIEDFYDSDEDKEAKNEENQAKSNYCFVDNKNPRIPLTSIHCEFSS
jgi:hypothetical protein